jgi:hypothetical protein
MHVDGASLCRSGIAGNADPVTDDALVAAAAGLLMPGGAAHAGHPPPEDAS